MAFGPFIFTGGFAQFAQILSRLFPFQRGLIHDYWAPNFWAVYYFIDKVLNLILSKLGFLAITIKEGGELHHLTALPNVQPIITTLIILVVTLPLLYSYCKKNNIKFETLVFLCGSIFFMFGYHVHEKAITPYIGLLMVFYSDKQ